MFHTMTELPDDNSTNSWFIKSILNPYLRLTMS